MGAFWTSKIAVVAKLTEAEHYENVCEEEKKIL